MPPTALQARVSKRNRGAAAMKALKCCYHQRESRDHASPQRVERTLFLMSLINHLEHIQERLSEHDWQAFSGELYDRILPTTGTQKLHKQDLEKMIDGVREQCARWGKNDEQLRKIAEQDERALVLPKQWKEDQELRNQVHRLFRKLGDNEAARAAQLERGQGENHVLMAARFAGISMKLC